MVQQAESEVERQFNGVILKDRDEVNAEIKELIRELQEEDKRASLLSLENFDDYDCFDIKAKNLRLRP